MTGHRREWERGRIARIAGKSANANPNMLPKRRAAWLAGWLFSDDRIRARHRTLPPLEAPEVGDLCPSCGKQREVIGFCGACDDHQAVEE